LQPNFEIEISGLLTPYYEPNKKTLYVELHNRVFPLDKLDTNCKYCGSKAFYKLTEFIKFTKNIDMAKTEIPEVKKVTYELVNPEQIATVKLFGQFMQLDIKTGQEVLQAAYNAGHTLYVKKAE
jgi:hypothetical protein